jgi:hypothetical protein
MYIQILMMSLPGSKAKKKRRINWSKGIILNRVDLPALSASIMHHAS